MQVWLNAGVVAANWRISTRSIVILVWSQVYRTERPPYLFRDVRNTIWHDIAVRRDAARRAVCERQLILVENLMTVPNTAPNFTTLSRSA